LNGIFIGHTYSVLILLLLIMGNRRGVYRVLIGEPEGKRLLGRPRHRWEDNIKMDLEEVEWGSHGLD
jgi:hypothetical protein